MAHQDNVWKALHYMPPTPQKSRVEQVGGELKSYPSVHKGTMPAPPPIEDRPRAANYPVHLRPQEVSDYSPLRLDPLQHSPSLVQAASLDLPGAVHRPYLDPLPLAANGGNSAKELISMIQSRLMALEGRASTIEETASQALRSASARPGHIEEHIAKMSTALAHAESELSTLRRAYGEQEHHRRHLEGRLQEMLDARTATSAELQDQKHRVEHVEREVTEAKSLAQRLEGYVAYEKDLASQEHRAQQNDHMLLRDESRRRETLLTQQMAEFGREIERMKQAASFARDESIAAYQQLASKIEGTEAQIGQYLKTQQSGMDRSSLQKDVNSLWDVVRSLKDRVMESTARQSRDERSAFVTSKDLENRIAAAEALILKQTIHVVDSRNKELERRWDELEDRVEERTASRAAEDEEKLSHVAKSMARDKKSHLERMLVMERSIREVLARQDDSAESMRRLVKQSHDDFMTLASHSKAELLEQTARLQEQTSDALATITKFTRDMEEQQERGRLGLEEVVRMEIKSRMSSTNKLRDTVSKLKQEVRGEIKDIRSASTERVARIEQKTAVLLSAERKLYARQAELETTFAEHMRKLDDALLSLKEEVEELSVNQVLAESLVQEDVTVRLREGWDTLGEALGKELREDSAAMREQIETSITQAIALVDQDTARFHEEIQRQLAGLAKQRSDDLKLIQEVAEEAMRRCDEEEQTAASIQQELDELLEGVVGWAEKQRNLQEDVEALQGHLAGGSSSRLSAVEGKIDALDDALQELQVSTASNETVSEVARAMDEQFDMQEVGMHSLQQNIHKLREDFESSVNKLSMEVEAARREAPEIHARQAKAGAHVVSDDELPLPTLTSLEGQLIDMEVDAVLASELTAIEHGAVLDAVLSLTSAFRESERRVSGLTVLAQGLEEHQRAALVQLEASQTEKAERSAEELDKVNARVRELAANVDRQMEDMDGAREQLERRVLAASSEALLAREAADELKSRLEGLEVDIRLSEELVAAELEDATRGRNQQEGQDLVERLATVRADIEAERERRRHLESQQEAHRTQLETAQEIHAVSLRSEIADLGKHIDGLRNDLAQLRVTQHETSHAQPEAREAGAATALSETAALATQVQGLADDVATLFKRHELLLDAGVLVESRVDGVEQELKQAAEIGSTNSERMDELQVEMTLSEESLRAELAGMVEQLSQEAENVRIGEQEVRNQVDALRSQLEASHEALELRLEAAHQAGARPEELKRVEDGIAKLAADVMQLKGSAMEPARTTDEFASALRRLEEHLAAVDADMVLADEVSKVEEEWVLDRIQSTSEAVSAALENYSDMLKWKEGIDSLVEEARPQFEGIRESVSHLANPPLASTPAEPQADQHWRQEAEDKSQLLAAALASAGQDIEGLQRRQSVLEQQLGSLVKRVEEAAVAAQANAAAPRGETGANQSGTVVPQEVMSATSENLHDGLNNTLSAMSNMGDHLAALKETVSALESKVDQGGHDIVERLLQVETQVSTKVLQVDEELSRLKAWQDGVANAVLGSDADIPSNGDNATVSAAEVVAEARRTVQERVNALEGRITAMHEELMSSKLAGQREVQEPGGGILAGRIASAEESAQAALRAVDGLREEMAGVANASRTPGSKNMESADSTTHGVTSDELQDALSRITATGNRAAEIETSVAEISSKVQELLQSASGREVAGDGAAKWHEELARLRQDVEDKFKQQETALQDQNDNLLQAFANGPSDVNHATDKENRDELKTSLDELRDSFLQLKGSAVTNDELEQRVRDLVPATDDSRFQELSQSLHETVQAQNLKIEENSRAVQSIQDKISSTAAPQDAEASHHRESLHALKDDIAKQQETLDKHTELLGLLADGAVRPDDVHQQVLDILTEEQVMSHAQVTEMVDALRDEISADMDRADDIQNEFFDSVEETLARMEDRIQASEQEVGEIEQVLRGEMADWISRQMAEVRLAQSGAVDATPEDDALDGGEVRAASAKQNTAPPITDVPDGTESSNEPSNAQGATTIPEDEDADEEHT